ncbi:MAG: histidine kinase [Moraxellaceae bacterium]|nr:MAG: histidine kinase [Moraxellaceae bacterium]
MNVDTLFAEIANLPNIPEIVQELIESFKQEDVDSEEIAEKIAMDQVLSAKVLRMANSAHFGVSRTIASTTDAVVLLGLNAVRTMVLASGITGAFKAPEGFDIKGFWKQSFRTGAMAKWLAKSAGADLETAFTCGMLHNVGSVLLHLGASDQAASIDKAVALGADRIELEKSQIGVCYPQVGRELAVRWKFPEEITRAIGEQVDPLDAEDFSLLAGLLHVGKYIVECNNKRLSEEEIIAGFPNDVAKRAGLDPSHLFDSLEESKDLGSEFDQILD